MCKAGTKETKQKRAVKNISDICNKAGCSRYIKMQFCRKFPAYSSKRLKLRLIDPASQVA